MCRQSAEEWARSVFFCQIVPFLRRAGCPWVLGAPSLSSEPCQPAGNQSHMLSMPPALGGRGEEQHCGKGLRPEPFTDVLTKKGTNIARHMLWEQCASQNFACPADQATRAGPGHVVPTTPQLPPHSHPSVGMGLVTGHLSPGTKESELGPGPVAQLVRALFQ